MNWLSLRSWPEFAGFSEEDRRVVALQAALELRRCRPALAVAPFAVMALGILFAFLAEVLVPNEAPKFSPAWFERAIIVGMVFPPLGAMVFGVISHIVYLRCLRPFVARVIERAVVEAGKGLRTEWGM